MTDTNTSAIVECMIDLEYTQDLTSIGLSREQAVVYEVLLKIGESPVRAISKALPAEVQISRPLVYKVLEELVALDAVAKTDAKGKIALFAPKHPNALAKVIDEQKERIERVKKQFVATSGKLSSLFNLSVGKPGVQFFEGEDGIWEVLMDSMNATEEILSYADIDAVEKYIPDLNAEYSAMREEQTVYKRVMLVDSKQGRDFISSYDHNVTKAKLIKSTEGQLYFQSIIQIYDNKISYITLTDEYLIGIIITNQNIADTHKYLFESLWGCSEGEEV